VRRLSKIIVDRAINAGTPLLLMGSMWLSLWLFPWRPAYIAEPHWGHNYTQSLAFLCVGLAYFNRRFISELLALLASLLVIPAALELLPHPVTALAGGTLAALIIVDLLIERGRKDDLAAPANRRLALWLKRHMTRFSLIMLAHISVIYFFVRLPAGTYEHDPVTVVFDGMLVAYVLLALMERAVPALGRFPLTRLAFFWGMLTIIVALIILSRQPVTWPYLGVSLLVTAVAVTSLVAARHTSEADGGA
jgi:hypothetical protein